MLEKKTKCSSIPPLRHGNEWIDDSKAKADLFARTFQEKSKLPDDYVDCIYVGRPDFDLGDVFALRTRYTRKMFKKLDINKATGPDHISAEILCKIADEIAWPFTFLCRRLLNEGCWPKIWRLHQICPLYKRKTAFHAGNYRGIHLTTILSKTAERIIGCPLIPFLQNKCFGIHQWAFTPRLSARDLVTALMMSWILAVCCGSKIAAYLSDITGAFDRVARDYMLAKLYNAGVGTKYLNFLASYLQPRKAVVVVEGISSEEIEIANQMIQGAVLGPP